MSISIKKIDFWSLNFNTVFYDKLVLDLQSLETHFAIFDKTENNFFIVVILVKKIYSEINIDLEKMAAVNNA